MRLVPLFAVAAALAACQSVPAPDRDASAAPPATHDVVHGRAFHLERMLMPAGAVLEVQLIDDRIADGPDLSRAATIARMSYGELRAPPYTFDLPYDPARVEAGGAYSLRAALRDEDGRLAFITDHRVQVTPGAAAPVEFRLVRATLP